jgi:hypothetical protein
MEVREDRAKRDEEAHKEEIAKLLALRTKR